MPATLPHLLSLSRAAAGVCFPFVPAAWWPWLAAAAALTDYADGAASRLLGSSGKLGQWLDPICDKCFLLGAVVTLLRAGLLTGGEVLLLGLRDLVAFLGVGYLLLRRDRGRLLRLAPSLLGKLTTAAQFVYLVLLLFQVRSPLLLTVVATVSGAAAVDYLRRYARAG